MASIPNTLLSGPAARQPWPDRAAGDVVGLLSTAFLLWRVWDGGRFSRGVMLLAGFLGYTGALFHLAAHRQSGRP
ncbi:MAG TPA: hypothetical protein VE343_07790 [Streptosporangiaceae bacterium]|nr:hypothetical protein [Streptosporangiaceae bacterium]